MKKLIKIVIILLLIFLAVTVFGILIAGNRMTGQVNAFDRSRINLSHVSDGVYTGHSETDLVKVEVSVTVSGGVIRNIEILKHECGKGHPADVIVNDMITNNDTEVDAVSGATMSSEVIKDAVRNALRKGIK
ncbi:MAG: FMN-binding protein [Lachnospiraceae bacterium]|nr:FMN-binding protein [Lachnospiraceae bacterium]